MNVTSYLRLIYIICLLGLMNEVRASDISIYVSPKGKGDGSAKSPANLEMALRRLPMLKRKNPSGTIFIILRDGDYFLDKPVEVNVQMSGTADLKIVFKADSNAHPVIKGSKRVVLEGRDYLAAPVKSLGNVPFYDLYIDGQRAVRAREPNDGRLSNMEKVTKISERRDSTRNGRASLFTSEYVLPQAIFDKIAALPEDQIKQIRYTIYFKWATEQRTIDSLNKEHHSFYSTGTRAAVDNSGVAEFYLENFPGAFDAANEWIVERDSIKYRPSSLRGKAIADVPVLEHLLVIKGDSLHPVSNIQFENISFQYSNHPFEEANFVQAAAHVDAAITLDNADKIGFINCEVAHTGQYGIWMREAVKDCEVRHCYIHDLGAGGVRIGELEIRPNQAQWTSHNRVINCIIHSGGYNYPEAVGVFIAQSGDNVVEHNDIADFRYSGISVGWVWGYAFSPSKGNKICYNHIHHLGWAVLSDMAGIYTLGISYGTEVTNNIVHDIYTKTYGGWGLYTDEGSTGIVMKNNLVYNTKTGGFHQHYGENNIIDNNIFGFALECQVQYTRVEDHRSFEFKHNLIVGDSGVFLKGPWAKGKVDLDSNCYWNAGGAKMLIIDTLNLNSWKEGSGKDANSVSADPGFVDAARRDFKLKDLAVADKIGFIPFDYTKAGVYGSKYWIDLARLPDNIIESFNKYVGSNMVK